jgi:hypothetical protein
MPFLAGRFCGTVGKLDHECVGFLVEFRAVRLVFSEFDIVYTHICTCMYGIHAKGERMGLRSSL